MCDPVSIGLGVISTAGGMMQAQAQHNAQKAAVARQNQIAQQQYQQELRIQGRKAKDQADAHDAALKAQALAANDLVKQTSLNQLEANRAQTIVQQKKNEKDAKASFELEEQLAKAIKAQGAMLATGNAGQSFLLQVQQSERELGMAGAQIQQSMYDSAKVFELERQGVIVDQYSRDVNAYNNLPAHPVAPTAPHLPYKPIKMRGPSGGALMGAMIGAVGSGVGTGLQASSAISNSKTGYASKYYN